MPESMQELAAQNDAFRERDKGPLVCLMVPNIDPRRDDGRFLRSQEVLDAVRAYRFPAHDTSLRNKGRVYKRVNGKKFTYRWEIRYRGPGWEEPYALTPSPGRDIRVLVVYIPRPRK